MHQACHTLTSLAYTAQDRIRAAARNRRILVPTQSLPDTYDIPRPFASAPPGRIRQLLGHYTEARLASREATAAIEQAAEPTRTPSRVLTAARAAATGSARRGRAGHALERLAEVVTGPESAGHRAKPANVPGPVELTLRRLGITSTELLSRGADIDRAGERLIIDAAANPEQSHYRPSTIKLNTSTGTTSLIKRALVSGDPRVADLLRRPEPPSREPPQPQPEAEA